MWSLIGFFVSIAIGSLYFLFSFLQLLLVAVCAIPLTKELNNIGALKSNKPMQSNILTIVIHSALLLLILCILGSFAPPAIIIGFLIGNGISLSSSFKSIGMKPDNISEFLENNAAFIDFDKLDTTPHLNSNYSESLQADPKEETVDFLDLDELFKNNTEQTNPESATLQLQCIENCIAESSKMLNKAKTDLGDLTEKDILDALQRGDISQEEAKQLLNAYQTLKMVVETTPNQIETLEKQRAELLQKIKA